MVATLTIIRTVLAVTGLSLLAMAGYAWRTYDGSALRPFVVLLGLVGLLAISDAVAAGNLQSFAAVWVLAYMLIPVAFGWFVVEYYGLPYLATRGQRVAFLVPVAVGIAGGVTIVLSPSMGGVMSGGAMAGDASGGLMFETAQLADSLGIFYAGGVMVAAILLLLRTCRQYAHLDTKLGVTLSFVALWPWTSYLTTPVTFGAFSLTTIIGLTTAGYVVSALAAASLVSTGRLFDATPAAGTLGPDTVLAELGDLVFVIDREGRIVRLNEAVKEAFGTTDEASVGRTVESVVGVDLETLRTEPCVQFEVDDRTRHFEASVSSVTDRHGRTPGETIVLRDVTKHRMQGQRLTVLNRVLRHNLRNRMTTIIGRAQILEAETERDEIAESILSSADDLVSLGERAREVEEMMSVPLRADATAEVGTAVDSVIETVATQYPEAAFVADVEPELEAATDEQLLIPVLENLVENGARHNDSDRPEVVIEGRVDPAMPEVIELTVSDNGPGIPEAERSVLDSGDETPLEHGSGLGLWAVYWGITRIGGELAFEDNDPRGTTVRLRIPRRTEQPEVEAETATGTPTPVEAN